MLQSWDNVHVIIIIIMISFRIQNMQCCIKLMVMFPGPFPIIMYVEGECRDSTMQTLESFIHVNVVAYTLWIQEPFLLQRLHPSSLLHLPGGICVILLYIDTQQWTISL